MPLSMSTQALAERPRQENVTRKGLHSLVSVPFLLDAQVNHVKRHNEHTSLSTPLSLASREATPTLTVTDFTCPKLLASK